MNPSGMLSANIAKENPSKTMETQNPGVQTVSIGRWNICFRGEISWDAIPNL